MENLDNQAPDAGVVQDTSQNNNQEEELIYGQYDTDTQNNGDIEIDSQEDAETSEIEEGLEENAGEETVNEDVESTEEDTVQELKRQITEFKKELEELRQVPKPQDQQVEDQSTPAWQDKLNNLPYVKDDKVLPESWKVAMTDMASLTQDIVTSILDARDNQAKEAEQQQNKAREAFNAEINNEMQGLVNEGLLPKLSDEIQKKLDSNTLTAEDRKIPAVAQRIELLKHTADEWDARKSKIDPNDIEARRKVQRSPLDLIFKAYMANKTPKKPAGAKTPVSVGKKNVNMETSQTWDYSSLHEGEEPRNRWN